jgi:hypothetical protein
MSSSRQRVADIIRPMLPEGWAITAQTVATIPTLSAPAVFIDYTSITHDGMPAGSMVDGFEVALLSHLKDYGKAEDAIDPVVRSFVRALDASDEIAWSRSDKRNISDYLAWVVTVQLPVNAHQE